MNPDKNMHHWVRLTRNRLIQIPTSLLLGMLTVYSFQTVSSWTYALETSLLSVEILCSKDALRSNSCPFAQFSMGRDGSVTSDVRIEFQSLENRSFLYVGVYAFSLRNISAVFCSAKVEIEGLISNSSYDLSEPFFVIETRPCVAVWTDERIHRIQSYYFIDLPTIASYAEQVICARNEQTVNTNSAKHGAFGTVSILVIFENLVDTIGNIAYLNIRLACNIPRNEALLRVVLPEDFVFHMVQIGRQEIVGPSPSQIEDKLNITPSSYSVVDTYVEWILPRPLGLFDPPFSWPLQAAVASAIGGVLTMAFRKLHRKMLRKHTGRTRKAQLVHATFRSYCEC